MLNFNRLRGAGTTFLTIAIVSGAAITTLGQRQYTRLTTDEVWAAANVLSAGHTVQAADLQVARVERSQSAMAINDPRAIVGRKLVNEKKPGDVIQQGDVAAPQRLGMTDVIPADRVVYTLSPDRQLVPYTRQLRTGDSFDILATSQGGRVSTLASDVILLGNLQDEVPAAGSDANTSLINTIISTNPQAGNSANNLLVLAVKPEQVYPLASALGSNARISLVAHARPTANNNRLVVPAPPTRERRVEVINGLERAYVNVRQSGSAN